MGPKTSSTQANLILLANCLLAMTASLGSCGYAERNHEFNGNRNSRNSQFLARREAADDSTRPITRLLSNNNNNYQPSAEMVAASHEAPATIVMGKFKAPSPDKIYRQRVPKSSSSGEQTMSASFQVMDNNNNDSNDAKIVNGVIGASALNKRIAQQQQPRERKVSAKMQVSDDGLHYPPSKLSADIYGNVAEIVTAPPEAVDSDFLAPQLSQLFGNRRP